MAERVPGPLSAAPVVAIAAWLVPGLGYLLIGQWARGITTGVTIIGLFLAGLLIAGVRVVEVPGYTDHGERRNYDYVVTPAVPPSRDNPRGTPAVVNRGWVIQVAPLAELRDKPWSVPQVLAGPIAIAAAATSVWASGPDTTDPENVKKYKQGLQGVPLPGGLQQAPFYKGIGVLTHARINDIGSLYLSVAGLLNLMTIIDAAHRATRLPAAAGGSSAGGSSAEDPE